MSFAYSETPELVRAMLGAILRRHREASERTLAELAEASGTSPAYLSEVERGRKEISTERLLAVVRALGTSAASVYAELASGLGSSAATLAAGVLADPESQLRLAAHALSPAALRTVADFSAYLLTTQRVPRSRRIGFATGGRSHPSESRREK